MAVMSVQGRSARPSPDEFAWAGNFTPIPDEECLRLRPCYAGRRSRMSPAAASRAPAAIITSHGAGSAGDRGAVPPNPAETAPFGMV